MNTWKLWTHGVTVSRNLFATSFFTLTGFHGLHVLAGLVALGFMLARTIAGDFHKRKSHTLATVGLYWYLRRRGLGRRGFSSLREGSMTFLAATWKVDLARDRASPWPR